MITRSTTRIRVQGSLNQVKIEVKSQVFSSEEIMDRRTTLGEGKTDNQTFENVIAGFRNKKESLNLLKEENKFHLNKTQLLQNLKTSLTVREKPGMVYYAVYCLWIPFMFQKYAVLEQVQAHDWLKELKGDLQKLVSTIRNLVESQYVQTSAYSSKDLLRLLTSCITNHSRWEPVNNLFLKIMSRLRNSTRVEFSTPETFNLNVGEFKDLEFNTEIGLLKDIYWSPSIDQKLSKLKDFKKHHVGKETPLQKVEETLEYCILKSQCPGYSEMVNYIMLLAAPDHDQILYGILVPAKKLETRDLTGFAPNNPLHPPSEFSFKPSSFRFLSNKNSTFEFISPTKINHSSSQWETLLSWNHLQANCSLTIHTRVPHNFIKFGVLIGNTQRRRDYSQSPNALLLNPCTGKFSRLGQVQSTHKKFPSATLNIQTLCLKVEKGKIMWTVENQEVVSHQLTEEKLLNSRAVIIFKRGFIEVEVGG